MIPGPASNESSNNVAKIKQRLNKYNNNQQHY